MTKRGLHVATERAGLNGAGETKLHTHDLRHGFASMLIREGADVVFVSRQLGHANPAVTLSIYSHLFDAEAQSARMRDALEARFGGNGVGGKGAAECSNAEVVLPHGAVYDVRPVAL